MPCVCAAVFDAVHWAGIKVVLTGDGSDELFGGYAMYRDVDAATTRRLFLHKIGQLARTALQREGDVVGRHDAAEALAQCRGFERNKRPGRHRRTTQRVSRSRPTSARATRNSPIQNIQNCGAVEDSTSCRILNTTAPAMPP